MRGDRSSPGCGLTLTSERVSLIPKRNGQQYLQAYIDNQRRVSGNYIFDVDHVVDGCVPSENRTAFEQQDSEKFRDLAFETPVLKPRVPVLPSAKTADNTKKAYELPSNKPSEHGFKLQDSIVKEADVTNKRKRVQLHSSIQEENSRQDVEAVREKPAKKRVHIGAGTKEDKIKITDDHAKRLEERRKRRKSKKDIMKPPTTEENQERFPKKKQRKQGKDTQIGFALMHSFAATNVGKNRLTLEPISRDFGVFQKGKASRKASVSNKDQKEQGRDKYHFSEAKFLNSKSSRAKKTPVSSSSSALSDDETIEKHIDLRKNPATKNLNKKKDVQEVLKSPVPDLRDRLPYNPEESIVWDIEKDNNIILESDSNNNPRSILVRCPSDFVKTAPKPKAPCQTRNDADPSMTLPTVFKDAGGTSSLSESQSLAPSQSASQVAQKLKVPQDIQPQKGRQDITGGPSKYFIKNAHDMSVADPLVHDPPAPKPKEVMADYPSPECHATTSLEIAVACSASGSWKDPQYIGLDKDRLTGICDDPMLEQQSYQLSEALESPSAPMGIIYGDSLGSGLSECYVVATGPVIAADETLSMYCSSPLLWSPSNVDDYSLEAERNDLTCKFIQDHYLFSTDVSDVDWKSIGPGEDHLINVDHDDSSDTYLDSPICQSDLLLGLFPPPHSFDHHVGEDASSQWQYTGEDRLVSSHDVTPYNDDHCPQPGGDIELPEIDLCSTEQHSECSLTGFYIQDEASVLGDNFCQGRDLLRSYNSGLPTRFSNVEAEVAGLLKGCHWLPQRF